MLRVVICDDSPGYAVTLRRMLEHDGDITVVAACASAGEAMSALNDAAVDLLIVAMSPRGTNGLGAVEEIMSFRPLPVLVLMSGPGGKGAAAAALAAGALDAIGKDEVRAADPAAAAAAAFRDRVRLLARAMVIRHPRARLRRHMMPPGSGRRASAIGFCASTGGPKILAAVLAALPASYPIPLLVVQHISSGFTAGLVRWLGLASAVPVSVAADGAEAGPGAWIAPEGTNLRLGAGGRLHLDRPPGAGAHLQSGDALFTSIAAAAGRSGIAIVLTGMGRDGVRGAAAVRMAGGITIAQDEESSPLYGMPKAAAEAGADLLLSPAEIIAYLRELTYQPLAGP